MISLNEAQQYFLTTDNSKSMPIIYTVTYQHLFQIKDAYTKTTMSITVNIIESMHQNYNHMAA
jgi:hypothetical protein